MFLLYAGMRFLLMCLRALSREVSCQIKFTTVYVGDRSLSLNYSAADAKQNKYITGYNRNYEMSIAEVVI
jgi:hypothetical protein